LKGQTSFLHQLIAWLNAAGVPYMVAGSLGSSYHGEPRATQDVDVVIDPTKQQLEQFLSLLDDTIYVSKESACEEFTRRGMFNIIDMESGWKADLVFRKYRKFSEVEFDRRVSVDLDGLATSIASAEDIILSKLEWAREGAGERQIRDAIGVALIQGSRLDREYLDGWAGQLGVEKILQEVLSKAESLFESPKVSEDDL